MCKHTRVQSDVHAQKPFPLLFLLLRPHPPGDSWQGGQRTIQKEAAAPEQNTGPPSSREARCPPAHTEGPPLPVSAALWPRRRGAHSQPPPLPSPRCQRAVLLLHFRVLHLRDGVCGFHLLLLQVLGPHVVHPVHQVHLEARPPSAPPGLGCP